MDMNGDGIDDAFDSTNRAALTVAMQIGEKLARLREDMARQAATQNEAVAREYAARFEAERGAARAELRVVDQPDWWDRATVQDVARVAQTAEAWRGVDETAQRASERIETEVRERYGVEVADLRSGAAGERTAAKAEDVEAALLIAEADRLDRQNETQRDDDRDPGADDRDRARELEELAEQYDRDAAAGGNGTQTPEELRELATDARGQAQLYRAAADTADQTHGADQSEQPAPDGRAEANRSEAAVQYDSAERRRDKAQQMESDGVPAADVRARMRADVDQGRPAAEALTESTHTPANRRTPNVRVPQRVDRSR